MDRPSFQHGALISVVFHLPMDYGIKLNSCIKIILLPFLSKFVGHSTGEELQPFSGAQQINTIQYTMKIYLEAPPNLTVCPYGPLIFLMVGQSIPRVCWVHTLQLLRFCKNLYCLLPVDRTLTCSFDR